MEESGNAPKTIDEYIAQYPPKLQKTLMQLRNAIKKAAPEAEEKISWQMPTFYLYGNLVHFAAHKNHIGFYPAPTGIESFKQRLSTYKSSKGAVQFPIDEPLPLELIQEIVAFRAAENVREHEAKTKKK